MMGGQFGISLLMVVALAWPLLVCLSVPLRRWGLSGPTMRYLDLLWLSAPWPALGLAYLGHGQMVFEGWIFGAYWELGNISRPWLAFTALLWTMAGFHARGYLAAEQRRAERGDSEAQRHLFRLALLWPLTLAGNLLLVVAQDIASFYLGFAVMTFAAYGLVVHSEKPEAILAARVYLIMAMLGEALILGGLMWAAGANQALTLEEVRSAIATADNGAAMALLLWLGFGVKAGIVGLHVWLPLAHPAAPAPASAVLSGAMIKAGLLGWINVLPLGELNLSPALIQLGEAMLVSGMVAAFGAALYGVMQRHPKAVLAYSSISQMGMLTAMVGSGLADAAAWALLWPALVLFAAHHALAKGALFMGTSISEHLPRWPVIVIWGLLALPGLSLAGALGSGLIAKWSVKTALHEAHHDQLVTLLTWATVGTTALVSVALWRQWQQRHGGGESDGERWQQGGWLGAVVAALVVPLWLPLSSIGMSLPSMKELPGLIWPLPVGIVMTWAGLWLWRGNNRAISAPAGDLWWGYVALLRLGTKPCRVTLTTIMRVKAAGKARALEAERRIMAKLAFMLKEEAWMRHHTAGLMMALALCFAMLLALSAI
ncbi:complex I subunit 5 family protein [Halomonas sp. Bachu 37]|uniref:complex I subunit 5 family protein n=1 Tax=Halomonas kashgarensis TaxID=3084920 RepID=UPI0032169C92